MTEPVEAGGSLPGDYGVGTPADRVGADGQPAPDAGNTEDIDCLVEPLDPDDDVYDRIDLVNTQGPDKLEQAPDGAQ
jgi:hypothetical protein